MTLVDGVPYSDELRKSLVTAVRSQVLNHQYFPYTIISATYTEHFMYQIGAFAAPDKIHWAPGLPKTRSGKIMRRILRKIAARQYDELGDTSTLAEPQVVQQLIELADV